jgi:hypothetical protein
LDQENTSSDRLSKTTTKPTASSSLKGDGIYRIPGQPEGVFFKKEGSDWYKKQYGVTDYTKVTDPNRIKKFESNTVPYEPKEKEEIYILPNNPGALYKKNGKHWSKKVGQNYIPIKLGDVSAREEILNQQAVVATKFDLDRMADYAPEVDQQLKATPIENKELKKSFEQNYGDIKVLEKEMEQKRLKELQKPAPQEDKNLNWRYGAGKIFDFDNPDDVEAFKDISPALYMDYYDSNGDPIGIMDADKMKAAEANMKKDFGEIEFKAYHSVAKIPSREKLYKLGGDNAAKLLNNQFKGTNIRFYQDGSEIRIVSKLGSGINEEVLNEKTLDLSSPEFDKYVKSFVGSNILKKSEKDKFNNASTIDDLVELVGTQPYKFSPALLEGIDIDSYYQKKRKVLEGELARSKADSYEQDSKTFDKEVQEFNTQIKGGKMSNQEFDKKSAELEAKRKDLESRRRVISNTVNEAEKIDNITNNLYKADIIDQNKKEQEGSFLGLIGRQFGQGLTNVSKMGVDFAATAGSLFADAETFANAVSPGSYQELKNLGYSDDEIKNETQKIIKSTGNKIIKDVPNLFGAGTTEEYAKSEDRGQIEQAVSSLAESIGTMAGGTGLAPGSKLAQDTAFFAMAYNAMEDQMRGPAFDGLSENEKKIISLPYGLIIGQLEKYGAKVGLSAADSPILNAFSKYVMSKVFTSLPKKASLLEIKTAIDKSVAASIANGMIKIGGAGFIEGGTEFTQQIFEGVEKDIANKIIQSNQLEAAGEKYDGNIPKEIVDQIKENDFFKDVSDLTTSEGISQLLSQSADAFKLGFLAGGIGGTVSVGIQDPISNKISNNRFKIYKDLVSNDEARNGFIASINAKVESGKLTRVEADRQIKSIEDSYPVIMRIPDNLSTSAQREAFGLIAEKDALERDIIGKDPALVAKQKDRIAEINEQLKITSYAVQEQTTSEVSVQPGAEVSGEMAQGESQTGPQVIAEEGTITEEEKVTPVIEPSGKTGQLTTVETDQVAAYRAEEQAELLKAIPKIESYKVNGEIDKTLMPKTVLAKYNKIYDKYDKLISPLLETTAQINVAPLFNTKVTNIEEAKAIQDSDQYKQYKEKIGTVAVDFGIKVDSIEDSIGGYAGVSEVSNIVNVTGDWNSIVEFAAVFGAMTPEVQDSTIAGRTIESGSEFHNTDRYEVELDNQEAAMKAAADAGFDQEGFTLTGNKIMFFNIFEYPVEDFDNKYITFVDKYTEYGGKIGSETKSAIQSEFIDSDRRAEIITKIEGDAVQQTGREGVRNAVQEAKPRNEAYRKINELLTTDTNNQSNLEKVLGALDKIEGDLDQFGKETLGVNIPVVLAKAIIKAVKVLVKAGVTLEQAIKQVAAENGLNDRDVKSLLNPTKVSEIDVNEVRSKDRPGKRISKGLSVKAVGGKKVIEETDGLSLEYVKENAPKVFISNANIIAKYPLVAGKQKFREATTVEQAQEIYDVFVREVADNLNYLMNEFKPEFREISTLWYDGANAIANDFAEQFGVSPEQAAGIIAAMSPQKDWYQNVRLAELVLMAYKDNPALTKEMIDYQKQINQTGLYETQTSPGKKLKKAEKAYKASRTKANKEALDQAKVKLQKAINKANAIIKTLEQYVGQKLNDVPADMQPYMVRTYHEVNTTKDYNIVAPDGSIQGVATKNNGDNAKVAWGSYSEIGKAVAIKNDGSQENITRSLGEMHKIRNFYNNIIDPMSEDGDVTMDTHAIAAALLLPLSGNSTQVGQNFGTGTSNSGPLGIKGLYYAYADAYALAAKEAGLLPRQVQSITWEAVRGLYTDTFKGNKAELAKINNIWKNYQDGKITINEAREQAKESAGGIKDPTWAGGPLQDESGASVQEEGVGTGREGDGRDIIGGELGGEILTADTKDKTVLKKALDVLNKADQDLGKFGRETLGINIPVATMRAIIKAAKVLVKTGITLQEAIIKAAEQLNVSKEDALNAVKFMSETIKAPVKKVLVNEAAALKDQLRLEARAAREAKTDLNTKRKQIAAFIRSLETKGTITARQASALVKRVSSLNLDNQTMVDRFEQYAEKVFKRAEYQDLLTSAFKVRRLIRKAIKSENQAEVVGMAKLFSKIDPSLVDDIDNYIALAESVLNAVRPSKEKGMDVALRQAANIETIAEYATTEIAKQEENRKREIMAEYKYLVDSGVLTQDLSVKEMQEIINLIDNPTAEFDPEADQKKLNFLQNRLASMEAVFKYMMANNINPFTGEEVVIEAKDADLIKRLLKMDLTEMSVRDSAKVVEAMDNYLMNNITSGLEAAVRSYEGAQNAKQLVAQGKKARPLRSYFNKTIGRFFGEQMISLPLLFEKMFPGIKNSANIMQMMGLVDVINGSNKAIRQHNDLMTEYSKQDFYKEKGFMEAKNVYERGMLSFLKRNLIGTNTEIRDEFKRRAEIIKQSIDALRENGTDKEIEMADLYQEAYDKLGVTELDLDVIEANADQMNKDAVDWMINEWGKHYGELADVSLSVYNSMLGSDTNYTPDRYKSLSSEDKGLDEALLNSGSGFMMSMDYTDKNKTGVLMEATRPKVLPMGRYISLDFDVNNFNSLKGALVDINTAAAIRQVDGFTKSKAFNKLVPEAKDRKILTKRINTYIQRAKGKRTVTNDTIKDVERLANFVTGLGVGKALAGLDQPIKQTVPVMINTMINSGGTMTFVTPDMNEAINRSGMPIANRGLESQTAVESIDRLLDKTGGLGAEAIKKLEDLNQFWLKTLLAKPDVWVARSSFITYYLKDMKSKGVNIKDINWETHEWDKESAQYAQLMVDRQQNISDDKLAGDFLSSDDPTKRIARKVIMPFATFIMNQKARMHNDFLALRSKDASIEDRKSAIKSLTGLGAELAAYQLIGYGIKTLVYDNIANLLVGDDDEEEKKDKSLLGLKMTSKQYSATKFPIKSIVGDILSPLPIFDDLITMGFDKVMESFPQISNEDIKKAVEEKNTILRLQGKDEMDDKTKTKFIEQLKSDNIYSVAFKNDGQSGRSYGMIGIAYDTYKELIDLSVMAYTGEFEDEYEGRVTNRYLPEEDRKILQNISVPLMILYSTGIAPKDLGAVARKVTNIVKKKGVTENQHEKEKEVKKQINRDLNSWEFELVKTRKKADGVVDEINYVESKGGLDDKQGKEYVKLIDVIPTPSDDMLRDIQKGMTADQIIKKNTE